MTSDNTNGTTNEFNASVIGRQLVEAAKNGYALPSRGILDQLFPYIYMAKNRMSSRAISRWLLTTHNVKLSGVSIAKSLRESEKHLKEYMDSVILPAATIVSEYREQSLRSVLGYDENELDMMQLEHHEADQDRLPDEEKPELYRDAFKTLLKHWYRLFDEETRDECLRLVPDDELDAEPEKTDDDEVPREYE